MTRAEFNELLTHSFSLFNTLTRASVYRAYVRLPYIDAAQLLCKCGYSICCTVRRERERLGFLVFFDDEEVSETYGERVACCPGCDARLDCHLLLQAF